MNNDIEKKWSELHEEIVNKIVLFLKENGVNNVSDVNLSIDSIESSILKGTWIPYTDSSFVAYDEHNQKTILCSI